MVEECSESFYAKYLRISLPFIMLLFLSISVFALTTSDNNYSAGVYNGGFEYGTGEKVGNGAIGDKNYGWYNQATGSITLTSDYNTTITHNGLQSLRVLFKASTGSTGTITSNLIYSGGTINPSYGINCYNVKPNTNYNFSFYVYIESLDTNLKVSARVVEYDSAFTRLITPSTSDFTTVGSWLKVSKSFTTQTTTKCVFVEPTLGLITGTTGTDLNGIVYFDDVRLEEVGSVPLTGQVSGRPSILVTGVSVDAVDQADTNNSSSAQIGKEYNSYGLQFTPTQNKFTGITIQRTSNEGTFIGDINFSLQASNSSDNPDGNILASYYFTNALWNALPINTDVFIPLPYVIDANGTNKYFVVISTNIADVNNYTRFRTDSGASYSGGVLRRQSITTGDWGTATQDAYFKTHFEKQSSAFDLNVCSNGDSVCESKTYDIDFLEDGETFTINPSDAPLFYSGDNNVYFMMHSDSDYNNKTPSMTAKIQYLFDHPTTTLSRTKGTIDNTEIITLTCTNGTTGTCDNTHYTVNGGTLTTYTTPFTLTNGTYTITYYSTDDTNNKETTNSTTFQIATQPSKGACGMLNTTVIILAAIIALGILVIGFKAGVDPIIIISLVMFAVAGVLSTIILAGVLFPICG